MAITEDSIRSHLKNISYPGFSRDIVSFGLVKDIQISGKTVDVYLAITASDPKIPETIKDAIEKEFESVKGVKVVNIHVDLQAPASQAQPESDPQAASIPGIKNIIAVASGKGGVGKSTVAANLAIALKQQGAKVGLCDCDIYGPSVGLMFGTNEKPYASEDNMIIPIERHGLKLMSMGFLLDDDAPAVLRGPLVTRYTQQFLRNVDWGDLDYLILDLPPGTGDIQLTIVQTVALNGAVIVTTPQEMALIDARKAASMFAKVNTPVLGIIENMSYFVCPSDGERYDIFGDGGGQKEADRLGVRLLGQIPINIPTREAGDSGTPIAELDREDPTSKAFYHIAENIIRT